ncbi:LamG-like jellyroll fold domain-containing protein [Streptomyces sp. NPDC001852]|uniref:LamG-like jellyroll fold domain-containing protein n=1 Tax=Streptomyces sp. NPDC001852 TaxID=3364619 RepID=UPI0036AADB4D
MSVIAYLTGGVQRRWLRGIALAVSGALLVVLGTQSAEAVIDEHALASGSAVLPHQRMGSAAGLSHQVKSAALRAKGSASSPKAKSVRGALPLSKTHVPKANERGSFRPQGQLAAKRVSPPARIRAALLRDAQRKAAKAADAGSSAQEGDPHIPGPKASGAEVVKDRTGNTSVFRNADGTLTARVYSRPVHYRTAQGTWADIDSTLVQGSDGRWSERADSAPAGFAPSGNDSLLVSYGPSASEQVGYSLQGAASVTGQASGNAITYPQIATSADLKYSVTSGGVKETLVLHDASAPTTWVFPLHLTGLTPSLTSDGSVAFKDSKGAVRVTIPHGYMEDSNIGKVSGEGATSTGVTYSLTTVDGAPALRVSLDASWLHDKARVFPVKVDPTNLNASSSTYVETPYDINFSTDSVLKVGSYDGGSHKANSYVLNWSFGSTFQNDYIEQASLYLDDVWSGGCTAEPVYVHGITSSWNVGTIADYPGLSYGSTIGSSSFEAGASCGGSSWHGIDIGDNPGAAGVKLLEGWAHGTTYNNGLALTADNSVVAAWKQFASVNSSYPPYLSVTYSSYGADYSIPKQTYTEPTATTTGSMKVSLTNRGTASWSTSSVQLATDIYNTSWTKLSTNATKTYVTSSVSPNSSLTMTGTLPAEPPGQYYVCWDMLTSGTSFYTTYNVPTSCAQFTSADTPPQIDSTSPPSNVVAGSLTPQLFASGSDPDNYPGNALTYDFQVYTNPTSGKPSLVVDSGSVSKTQWTVPAGKLAWNQSYYWTVSDSDGDAQSAWSLPSYFSTTVTQPLITSHLGEAAQGPAGRTFAPRVGNYTTSTTDADVSVAGPALSVTRSYNSLDPRTGNLFGAGWSTLYDMSALPDNDGSGAVVVTMANGQATRFGLNADGTTFTPPQGTYSTFQTVSGGGYTLTDKSGTTYTFGQQVGSAWKLKTITDASGRSETLSYNADGTLATATNTTSSRSLHFTWSGGHVTQVATDPATSPGGTAETWTYSYSGGNLTGVCPPTSSTACTAYSYTSGSSSGSHYRTSVLDANPSSYWRLGESTGTSAASEVAVNEGNDNGTYTGGYTLGAAGPLPGSPTTAATFNGSTGYVSLPNSLLTSASYVSVGMWFKTSASGVLFGYQKDALTGTSTPGNYTPTLYVGTSGKLYGEFWAGSVSPISTSSSVADGAWHYAVLSAAGNTQSLYLDGNLVGTLSGQVSVTGQPVDAIGTGFIGGHWPDEPHYSTSSNTGYRTFFNGSVAEAAFYTHALGLPAVQQQYTAGTHAASELTGTTLPSGKTALAASYDASRDQATQITDADGGTWKLGQPTTTGSGAYYRDAVISQAAPNYWRFEDTSGNQAANEVAGTTASNWWSSGPATYNNVTLGAPGLFTGSPETAASFNGTSSYVSLPSTTIYGGKVSANFSIELWFKTSASGETLFSYQSGPIGTTLSANYTPALYVGADGHLYGQWWDHLLSPMESPDPVNDGQWHQAVLTVNTNGEQTLNLDGQQADTRTGQQLDFTGENVVSIGAGYLSGSWPSLPSNNPQGYFNGSIAEVSTFNQALSTQTVAAQYAARGTSNGATPVTTATVTDPTGKTLSYRYDPANGSRLISVTDALGHTTSYSYDSGGFLATVTDPDGNFTTTTHNTRGDTLSSTTSDMHGDTTTSYTNYPATGTYGVTDPRNDQPISSADPRSTSATDTTYATSYTYDSAGNLLTSTDPDQHVVTKSYTAGTESAVGGGTEPAGLLATVKDAKGNVTGYAYDSAGDLAQVTSPSGLKTAYTYDNLGRRLTRTETSDTYPGGVTTSYTYDGQDRVVTATGPATTDAVKGTIHTPQTTYAYDDDGKTTSLAVADTTGGDQTRTTAWTYNSYDQLASVTDAVGRKTSYGYDAYGNRTSENDADGNAYTYAYSPTGELLSTTLTNYTGDPENPSSPTSLVVDSRAYDPAGWLASDTDSMGRTTGYYYNWNHKLIQSYLAKFHNTDGSTTTKVLQQDAYDAAGRLIEQQKTAALIETDYTVDPAGLVTGSVFDPYGQDKTTTSNSYDPVGNLTSRSVTQGSTTEQTDYTYDTLGDVTSQTVHDGSTSLVTTHTYDERGKLISTVDPRGNVTGATAANYTTTYANDQAGRLTQVTAPVVNAEKNGGTPQAIHPLTFYGYNTFGDKTSVDDPDGNITTYTYDARAEQVAVSDSAYTPPGSTTSITPTTTTQYNAAGQVSQVTDGNGNTTSYTYTQLGNLAQVVQPAVNGSSPTTHTTYDTDGEKLSVTDPTGAQTTSTYDDLGRTATDSQVVRQPSTVTDTTTYGYDNANNRTSITLPGGEKSTSTYDTAGDQLTATDPLNNTTTNTYDLDGRLTKTTLPDGTATTSGYDLAGRLTATSNLDATGKTLTTTGYGYDPAGNKTSVTDPNGNTTTYTYDATNVLTQQTEPVTSSSSITTSFGYDAARQRTRYTDGNGNATITTYNPLGLRESLIEPSTPSFPNASDRTTTVAYDAKGNPTAVTRPGGVTETANYDADGRLSSQAGSGAEAATTTRTFGYDADGRITSVSAPGGTDAFTYNDRGELLSSAGPSGSASYAYTSDGQIASRTDKAGSASYTYDSDGRLSTATDPLTNATLTYSYNHISQATGISYGSNSASQSFGYDSQHRLTSDTLTAPGGSTEASITYGYDADGHVTNQTTTGTAAAAASTYTYDQSGRLATWNNGTATTTYGYDNAGNRTTVTTGSSTTNSTYNARDELTSSTNGTTTTNYSYTARGTLNTVTGAGTTENLTYDAFDQLVTDGSASYTHDALGRLATRGSNTFTYNGVSNTIVSDGTDTYDRAPDGSILSVSNSSGAALAYTDQRGDLTATFTPTATTLVGSVAYNPYGQSLATTGTQHSLGYQGGWTDPATGRVATASRWYDPATGNFTSHDPTDQPPTPSVNANPYTYANDDPTDGTDPTGHDFWSTLGLDIEYFWPVECPECYVLNRIIHYQPPQPAPYVSPMQPDYSEIPNDYSTGGDSYTTPVYDDSGSYGGGSYDGGSYDGGSYGAGYSGGGSHKPIAPPPPPPPPPTALMGLGEYPGARPHGQTDGASPRISPRDLLSPSKLIGTLGSLFGSGYEPTSNGTSEQNATSGGLGSIGGAFDFLYHASGLSDVVDCATNPTWGGCAQAAGTVLLTVGTGGEDEVALIGERALEEGADKGASDAAAGMCSFAPSTPVLMANGKTKPIGKIKTGDNVEAGNPDTGKHQGTRTVQHVWINHDHDLLDLTIRTKGGHTATLHTTANHPFWDDTTHSWVPAGKLHAGDALSTATNGHAYVAAIRHTPGAANRWNLTVQQLHTYYVVAAGNIPILVHNDDGLCGVIRGSDGRFQSDPNRVEPDAKYDRVTLRSSTKQAVQDAAPRDEEGNFIDPNTGQSIPSEGPFHYGHKPGYEYWRNRDMAQAKNWTRQQFVDFENDPDHYQIEDPYNNMSHQYEQP